jgi:3-hydroxyisobutyrate dehydrogenase-like beta-hydroxyacid dehydrogenase
MSTIGLLYPGEMGAAFASLRRDRGAPVVTTLHGRSEATAARAEASGAIVLDSLAHVVRVSDVLVSLVDPAAAEEVARAYCELAHLAPKHAVFIDANSIGPAKARAIGRKVEQAGRSFVDGAINGLARNLATSGTLYLSGTRAEDVTGVFEGISRIRVLGGEPGRASAMKMLLGGLSKGLCALFTELALLAERQGMLNEMLEAAGRTYPGVTAVAERMLPTYPRHAGRRATEMYELEATARSAGGQVPAVIEAVRRFHEEMAMAFASANGAGGDTEARADADLAAVIRSFAERLQPAAPAPSFVKEKTYGH